ncbi:hypothetical protein LSUE1_G008210 [Lachnellula suecica]|uniref:BTB domain-containing protein n=1 Tax=Lachnellula suecica TaxID=602035 RepID=A0A8T9BXY1_9HELO|nr:hypothetical protein LSUE1_G008210 [Lachnellula suecica]
MAPRNRNRNRNGNWRPPPPDPPPVSDQSWPALTMAPLENQLSALTVRQERTEPKLPFSNPKQMVTFKVGAGWNSEEFLVYKDIACRGSKVFERAFNGGFEEGRTQTYELDDVDPDTFRYFSEWLYSQKLTLMNHEILDKSTWTEAEIQAHNIECSQEDKHLVGLWILGDKFDVVALQNYAIDQMERVRIKCGFMGITCAQSIYENTMPGSPLRRLVVDQHILDGTFSFMAIYASKFPQEMLADMVTIYARVQDLPQSKKTELRVDEYYVVDK